MKVTKKIAKVCIELEILDAPAFKDLGFLTRYVLLLFLRKRRYQQTGTARQRSYILTNNGTLSVTYKEMESEGICRQAGKNAITSLIDHGFLKLIRRGFGGVGEMKAKSEYELIETWKAWNKGPEKKNPHKRIPPAPPQKIRTLGKTGGNTV